MQLNRESWLSTKNRLPKQADATIGGPGIYFLGSKAGKTSSSTTLTLFIKIIKQDYKAVLMPNY